MAVKDWKEKENCIKRAVNCQKQREGWGWGSEDYTYPRSLLFCESPFAQQQSSWLVRLSSSCQSQAKCVVWTLNCSCGKMQTMKNSVNGEVISFDSAFEETPRCLSKFDMSLASSNWNKKKQFLHWFLERIYCLCCQLSLGKAWYNFLIFRCWFTWKKFWWRNLPSLFNQDTKLITLARPKRTPELQAK